MSAPARVLILFAHPALHRSRVQRALADAVRGLDGGTFRDSRRRLETLRAGEESR